MMVLVYLIHYSYTVSNIHASLLDTSEKVGLISSELLIQQSESHASKYETIRVQYRVQVFILASWAVCKSFLTVLCTIGLAMIFCGYIMKVRQKDNFISNDALFFAAYTFIFIFLFIFGTMGVFYDARNLLHQSRKVYMEPDLQS